MFPIRFVAHKSFIFYGPKYTVMCLINGKIGYCITPNLKEKAFSLPSLTTMGTWVLHT